MVPEGGGLQQCRAEGPAEPPAAHPEAGRGGDLGGAADSSRQRGSRGRGQRSNNVDTPADTTGELHTGHSGSVVNCKHIPAQTSNCLISACLIIFGFCTTTFDKDL